MFLKISLVFMAAFRYTFINFETTVMIDFLSNGHDTSLDNFPYLFTITLMSV